MRRAVAAALRFDRRSAADWAAWGTRAALLVGAFAAWVVPGWDLVLRAGTMLVSLGGLAGALIIAAIPNHDRHRMRYLEVAWLAMFALHYMGHLFDFYGEWALYDKVLHAGGGILAATCAYWLATSTEWFWRRGDERPFRVFWVCFSVAVVAGVAVEVVEYASDTVMGTQSQHHPVFSPLDDTMTDVVAEVVAGFAMAGWLAWRVRQEQPSDVTARRPAARGRSTASARHHAGGRD